jgi:hypothetical protein
MLFYSLFAFDFVFFGNISDQIFCPFFFLPLVVPEFELKASCLLQKFFTTLSQIPSPFPALVVFQMGSCILCLGLTLDHSPPTYTSHAVGLFC